MKSVCVIKTLTKKMPSDLEVGVCDRENKTKGETLFLQNLANQRRKGLNFECMN
ncbi:hypothetical protein HanRHA438_Chr04g0193221 [Helianthus annuus]|nr:hypothetical protein HanRHA438_Chr04g0193221 [Helianthus annuus]